MTKVLKALCRTCRKPKMSDAFRRYADNQRHDSCIECEDAAEQAKIARRTARPGGYPAAMK